jgi:putative SOS response-associated peptidase YedK
VSPSYYQPVITRGLGNNPSQSDRQVYQQPGNPKIIRSMKWGLIPSWAANDPKTGGKIQPVNIRDDSLTGKSPKPMFKNTRNTQRCLVVAQGFYEWKREGKAKVPYFSTPADQEDKDVPFVLFGAIYDRVLIAGHEIYSYAIITTPANDQFNVHDRMPLIFDPELDSEAIEYWLDPKTPMNDRIKNMIAPFKRKLTM